MLTKSDKAQVAQLQIIREHKINKTIILIKQSKKDLKDTKYEIEQLKKNIHKYHKNRTTSQKKLFDQLKKTERATIETLNQYQSANAKLIKGEEKISDQIEFAESSIIKKESIIKKHQETLCQLNKKIESLNSIKALY